jgi:hypothetical protein
MNKTMLALLVACLVGVVGCGGGSARTEATPEKSIAPEATTAEKSVAVEPPAEEKPYPMEGTRAAKYPRLAIVCAPGTKADPEYAPMVLKEIETMVPKYLSSLQKVDCVPNASVDTTTVPPTVQFENLNNYDAVAVITYTDSGPMIFLDINLIDAKTGQRVWFLQLHAKMAKDEQKIQYRLYKLAKIVPHRINKYFYRRG